MILAEVDCCMLEIDRRRELNGILKSQKGVEVHCLFVVGFPAKEREGERRGFDGFRGCLVTVGGTKRGDRAVWSAVSCRRWGVLRQI